LGEVEASIAERLGLTEEERQQWYPSGNQRILKSRITWAGTYLRQAQVLSNDIKGKYKISERGLTLLAEQHKVVNNKLLARYPEFADYLRKQGKLAKDDQSENLIITETEVGMEPSDPITTIET